MPLASAASCSFDPAVQANTPLDIPKSVCEDFKGRTGPAWEWGFLPTLTWPPLRPDARTLTTLALGLSSLGPCLGAESCRAHAHRACIRACAQFFYLRVKRHVLRRWFAAEGATER